MQYDLTMIFWPNSHSQNKLPYLYIYIVVYI